MGKKKPKQEIVVYGMSIHFGVCAGPVEYMSGLIVDEKPAWPPDWPKHLSGVRTLGMALGDLFGGEKKEGGLVGLVSWLPGAADQVMPEDLAAKFGRTSATMPAYRGIASIFFHQGAGAPLPGFAWRWNTPFLPGVWVGVARASEALEIPHARIWRNLAADLTSPGIDLGGGHTGNDRYQWDTYGSYAVWGEFDRGATIWSIHSGAARTVAPIGLWQAGGTVHLTDTGELVLRQGSTDTSLVFYDLISLDVVASVDLGAAYAGIGSSDDVNYGFVMDDITVGGDNWALAAIGGILSSAAQPWVLLKNRELHAYAANTLGPAYTGVETLSMGRQYAYTLGVVGLGRIEWNASGIISQAIVTPPGLSGSAVICHYFEESDEVVIVKGNGDIFVYSADLSTLLRSLPGTAYRSSSDTGVVPGLCKRMRAAPGLVGLLWIGPGVYTHIYHFSVATLALVRSIDIQATDFVNQSVSAGLSFVGFNEINEAVFVCGVYPMPSSIWYTAIGPYDSNPSHIIYECLTNPAWGMGAPESAIDVAAFTVAGVTLYNERFGLSMIWTQQSSIEDFVSEVLDHIQATLFVNPRTGLLTLKLIRNDYSIPSLPVFTPDNSVVTNFSRKLWGETTNEIVVTWTNPDNEEEETVVAQDLANIEAQGGVVSDSRNYYGVRRSDLAAMLAQRDLRSASTPLAKCDLEVNRAAWDLLPGDCCVLDSSDDGIDMIVMRVGPVDYGKPGDSTVRVSLVEDVFSLALADYTEPPESLWVDESEDPSPADHTKIVTLPYYLVTNLLDASVVAGVDYPEVFAGVLASEGGHDTNSVELYGQQTNAAGATVYANFGTKSITSRATLAAAIPAEAETVILSFPDRTQGNGPVVGGLMLIEGAGETTSEICLVSDLGTGGYTIKRGVLDTVPWAWPIGTPVWFVDDNMEFTDDTIRSVAETVNFKVLPTTSRGTLAASAAPVSSAVMTARPHLPLRPADVKANGDDGFAGTIDCIGVDPIPVTWARRNRETETSIIKAWTDGDVTPEAGQTTSVTLTDLAGIVLHTYSGIAGTSQNVTAAHFGSASEGYIVVSSMRDGLASLQAYRVHVIIENPTADTTMVTADTTILTADES